MLNGLDLFSGIGGISLGLRDYVRPIAYCEIDPYCHGVLLSRMADQYLLSAPIWNDIRTLRGSVFRGEIEIMYGGFPCQGFSVAGIGKGLEDERSGLFFEIVRLAKEIKPKFIFLENVPAITSRGGLRVVREIAEMGYDCRWCVISADSVGALHKRERWFLLAHANDNGLSSPQINRSSTEGICDSSEGKDCPVELKGVDSPGNVACSRSTGHVSESGGLSFGSKSSHSESPFGSIENGCNSNCKSGEQANSNPKSHSSAWDSRRGSSGQYWPFESREHWKEAVSRIRRTTDGVPFLVDRLRGLGNAVVPVQAKKAFKILMGLG